jgi:hypothetical protein
MRIRIVSKYEYVYLYIQPHQIYSILGIQINIDCTYTYKIQDIDSYFTMLVSFVCMYIEKRMRKLISCLTAIHLTAYQFSCLIAILGLPLTNVNTGMWRNSNVTANNVANTQAFICDCLDLFYYLIWNNLIVFTCLRCLFTILISWTAWTMLVSWWCGAPKGRATWGLVTILSNTCLQSLHVRCSFRAKGQGQGGPRATRKATRDSIHGIWRRFGEGGEGMWVSK